MFSRRAAHQERLEKIKFLDFFKIFKNVFLGVLGALGG
jgi:hypothetical protein